MFTERIETDRLILLQYCRENVDVFELYKLFNDRPEVNEYFDLLPDETFTSVKEANDHLSEMQDKWENGESAWYAVYPTDGEDGKGTLAGHCTLSCHWNRKVGRLGVILAEPYWGRAYASEINDALTELAFDRFDFELVEIGHAEGNDRSKRAIEKYIEKYDGQYDGVIRNRYSVGNTIVNSHQYTVTSEQYSETTR